MPAKRKSTRSKPTKAKHEALPGFVRTPAELAKAVGQSVRTLRVWFQRGCPGRTSNGFSVAAVKDWHRMDGLSEDELRLEAEKAERSLAEKQREFVRSVLRNRFSRVADAALLHFPKVASADRNRMRAAIAAELASVIDSFGEGMLSETLRHFVAAATQSAPRRDGPPTNRLRARG